MTLCPCGLGEPYASCCARYHAGAPAPTAEALMRSRFSAFAVHDAPYLLRTWAEATRPASLDLDRDLRWTRLEVLRTARGGLFDADGEVEFVAHYLQGGRAGVLREHSRFRQEKSIWVYIGPIGPLRDR